MLKSRGFLASSLSTYDFSILYTTLSHNLTKDKLVDLIKFSKEKVLFILHVMISMLFSPPMQLESVRKCQKVCEAPTFLLHSIYIRFLSKLYRHIVGIPMGTNCAPLVANLFLFCYESDFTGGW